MKGLFEKYDKWSRERSVKEAAQLKKRLIFFLIIYLPVAAVVLVMMISDKAQAGNIQPVVRTAPSSTAEEGSGDDEVDGGDFLSRMVSLTSQDSIYTYTAGSETTYELDLPDDIGEGGDVIVNLMDVISGWGQQAFSDIALHGEIDTTYVDDIPIIGPFMQHIARFLMGVTGLWTIKFGTIFLRLIIVTPFFILETQLSMLGGDFFPGSLFGIILGRVGSGGRLGTNYYGFELVHGNIYGVIGSIVYGIMTGVGVIGVAIKLVIGIASAAWGGGSGESRKQLKDNVIYNVLSIVGLTALPGLVYLACYLRDLILYELLQVAQWASSVFPNPNSDSLVGDASIISSTWLWGVRQLGGQVGTSYNPFIDRALDFQDGTILDSVMYAGVVILMLVFMFLYVSLALDTTISFGLAPISILGGKQSFISWARHMLANLLTPVIDIIALLIPLLVGAMPHDSLGAYLGIGFIQILICFSYFPLRKSIRARLDLQDSSGESMGMGSVVGAMAAARMAMSGIGKMRDGLQSAREGSEAAEAGAEASSEASAQQLSELEESQRQGESIDEAMRQMEGVDGDDGSGYNGEAGIDPGIEDEPSDEALDESLNDASLEYDEDVESSGKGIEEPAESIGDEENSELNAYGEPSSGKRGEYDGDELDRSEPADSRVGLNNEHENAERKKTEKGAGRNAEMETAKRRAEKGAEGTTDDTAEGSTESGGSVKEGTTHITEEGRHATQGAGKGAEGSTGDSGEKTDERQTRRNAEQQARKEAQRIAEREGRVARGEQAGKQTDQESLADKNIREAIRVSNRSNKLHSLAAKERNQADACGVRAAKLDELMKKEKAGILSPSEADANGFVDSRQAEAEKATLKRMQSEHSTKARQYGDLARQSDDQCNRARTRMGIGGRGALNESELQGYAAIQNQASLSNFQSKQMQRSLSPELQMQLYKQQAQQYKSGVRAGVGVSTALATVVGAGSWFLPAGVKAGALGLAAGVGGSVTSRSSKLNTKNYVPEVKVPEGMLEHTNPADLFATVEVEMGRPDDTPPVTPQQSQHQYDVEMRLKDLDAHLNGVRDSGDVYFTPEHQIRQWCYDMASPVAYQRERAENGGLIMSNEQAEITVSTFAPTSKQNKQIDLSNSKANLTYQDILWVAESNFAANAITHYSAAMRPMEKKGYVSAGNVPKRGSAEYDALLRQTQIRMDIDYLVAEQEHIPADQVTDAHRADYMERIGSLYVRMRCLQQEDCVKDYQRRYGKAIDNAFGIIRTEGEDNVG